MPCSQIFSMALSDLPSNIDRLPWFLWQNRTRYKRYSFPEMTAYYVNAFRGAGYVVPSSSAHDLHQTLSDPWSSSTLSDLLNKHDPASIGLVSHRPLPPWFFFLLFGRPSASWSQTQEAQNRETMDQIWPTVHQHIFKTANSAVNAIAHSAKQPTTALTFLHALLPRSYVTSQTLFLVNLNPHHFRPPSITPVSHRPSLTSLPTNRYHPSLILLLCRLLIIHNS